MTPTRSAAAVLGALALAVAIPTAAHAATVTQEGPSLVYTAAPGEANELRVLPIDANFVNLLEQGSARMTSRVPGCVPSGTPAQPDRSLRCGIAGISRLDVRLGDRGDSFGSFRPFPILVDAGSGDDVYVGTVPRFGELLGSPGGSSQVTFSGGSGRDLASYQLVTGTGVIVTKDDQAFDGRVGDRDNVRSDVEALMGSGQDDFLAGGNGADVLHSTGGTDQLVGNGGDDLFLMSARRDGPTRVVGGADRDTVSYAERSRGVRVSVDNDASPDGESQGAEGDRISETEVVEGSRSNDILTTAIFTTLGYEMRGGPGDDLIVTDAGRDRLDGGPGEDELVAGPNSDTVAVRDGELEARIDCGSGPVDVLETELREIVPTGCETRLLPGRRGV
jgi:hypothetical protein